MRPKEWLVAQGHLPKGSENARGRLSRENIARIEAAVAAGTNIEGYSVSRPTSTSPAHTETKVVKTAVASSEGVGETPTETVPEAQFIAMVGGNVIGNRTVCDNCHRSLNFHICGSPKVMYNGAPSVVVFKPRPNPEAYRPNRWW